VGSFAGAWEVKQMREGQETSELGKLWWGVLIVIVLPLFAIAVVLVVRSHVFVPNEKGLSSADVRALWAFIGSGVGAAVTLVGLLFTRSHNERTLALQKEAETRLALDTVVKSLDLVATSGTYAPNAKIAGSLAALVHLNHPIIAMRTLGAAWADGAIDVPSAVWLINEVFERGADQSQLEAAALLDIHATELCTTSPGIFFWPVSAEYLWPANMQLSARLRLLRAIMITLVSRPLEWWRSGGRAGWALSLFDEVVQHDDDENMRGEAAVAAQKLLPVIGADTLQYRSGWKPVAEVSSRLVGISSAHEILMLRHAQQELDEWVDRKV
jgi:hypothetical protein